MKNLDKIQLSKNEQMALNEIHQKVSELFKIKSIILFGSIVRGETDEESDIDLLILTENKIDRPESHKITDIVCDVNLKYDTNYSILVIDSYTWDEGIYSILPLKHEIQVEGIEI